MHSCNFSSMLPLMSKSLTCFHFYHTFRLCIMTYPERCWPSLPPMPWNFLLLHLFILASYVHFSSQITTLRNTIVSCVTYPQEIRNMESEKHIICRHPPTYGNLITVLSIDGGGIRGIIPAVVLTFLESELQVNIYVILWVPFRGQGNSNLSRDKFQGQGKTGALGLGNGICLVCLF